MARYGVIRARKQKRFHFTLRIFQEQTGSIKGQHHLQCGSLKDSYPVADYVAFVAEELLRLALCKHVYQYMPH